MYKCKETTLFCSEKWGLSGQPILLGYIKDCYKEFKLTFTINKFP